MRTPLSANLLFYLVIAIAAISSENFSPHPMLYFSSYEVNEMRAKALTTHEKIAADIREAGKALVSRPYDFIPPENYSVFSSNWTVCTGYGNSLCGFSMYSFLYPEDTVAFKYIKIYMDRMSNYPDWYAAEAYGKDQLPVSLSLTGFATAYDLLYNRFDEKRRYKYYKTIEWHTLHLYDVLKRARQGWTKQYIHNHVATNFVAILLGSLIVSVRKPTIGSVGIKSAKNRLDFTMKIFSHVTDGSIDEGVAYGSYTSRGLTQYVYLANRHLKTDHTKNPWLKEHFWFFYKTLLPGFQRSVGIADANHNWFFGPGSQLVFLDAYVMKNGYGNWLAAKIRQKRSKNKPLAMIHANYWSMLHTEYIFFNASLRPQKPSECHNKKLHVFHDWGVVVYGGAQAMEKGNTFLSFKSSVLNGEAVENIMYNNIYPNHLVLPKWTNFNPGHEHPDQNSFVFAPNGKYFITEALYGPKLTYLDNVILFSTSDNTSCLYPWKGQIGECSKWLKFKEYEKGMRGEILTAVTMEDDLAFFAGESVGAYSKSLELSSVFRGLLLLNPEVLIVFDAIKILPGSRTKRASAFFHNMLHHFEEKSYLGYKGAQVRHSDGSYCMFSLKKNNLNISLHNAVRLAGMREGPTNYINVTFDLDTDVTNIVHVFFGPNYSVKSASILPQSGKTGMFVSLNVNGVEYLINVSTSTKSSFEKKSHIEERIDVTGFAGYASVRVDKKAFYFGLDRSAVNSGDFDFTDNSFQDTVNRDVRTVTSSGRFSLSSAINRCSSTPDISNKTKNKSSEEQLEKYTTTITSIFLLIVAVFVVLALLMTSRIKKHLRGKVRCRARCQIYGIVCLIILIEFNIVCIDIDCINGNKSCFRRLRGRTKERGKIFELPSNPLAPFIFITSLPASGGELLESLFKNREFLYVATTKDGIAVPVKTHDVSKTNLCLWTNLQNKFNLQTIGWFSSLIRDTVSHFNHEKKSKTVLEIRRLIRRHFTAAFVLNDNTGFWTTKITWIRRVVGQKNFQPLLIVRDPRSWIHAIIHDTDDTRKKSVISSLTSAYKDIEKSCDSNGVEHPQLYQRFKQLELMRRRELHTTETLSIVWAITVANALSNERLENGQWRLHVIRFEDLLDYPETTSMDIFLKLGLPLGIRYMNKLTRLVRSKFLKVPFDNIITPSTTTLWKTDLSDVEVARIEEICCPIMKMLDYEC